MPLETIGSPLLWTGFFAFVLAMLALDLGVFHRKAHEVTTREAAVWSVVWVLLAALFGAGVWAFFGAEKGLQFATGFVIEKALAVDNLFVFVVLFSALSIPAALQHRVLFWGVLGALVMRAGLVFVGGALLAKFHWAGMAFGALLALTGFKLLWQWNAPPASGENAVVRALRRWLPVTTTLEGERFTVVRDGRRFVTPLFLALVAVEVTDVVFAVDSIPAIFAITPDPFIVLTSNVFAIFGLRSLYFLLSGVLEKFVYLKVGLALVLVFVGAKMLLAGTVTVPVGASLGLIATLLGGSVAASLWKTRGLAPAPLPDRT